MTVVNSYIFYIQPNFTAKFNRGQLAITRKIYTEVNIAKKLVMLSYGLSLITGRMRSTPIII